MTAPAPSCTVCGSTDTVTVDIVCGRRCAAHPPTFDPAHAVHLAVTGWPAASLSYCRTDLDAA